jgi:hypothetical protein
MIMAQSFQALKLEWYAKLRESGFEDIEQLDGRLKSWSQPKKGSFSSQIQTKQQGRQEYYRLAGWFLHENEFDGQLSRDIWEMHSMGCGPKKIYKELLKSNSPLRLGAVRRILCKLIRDMKQRYLVSTK